MSVDISRAAVERLAMELPLTNWQAPRLYRAADTLRALLDALDAALRRENDANAAAFRHLRRISELEAQQDEAVKWAGRAISKAAVLAEAREALSLIAVMGYSEKPDVSAKIARMAVKQAIDAVARIDARNE